MICCDWIPHTPGLKYMTKHTFSDTGSGVGMDWAKGFAGIKYAYSVEIDKGDYGFIAPPEEILPTSLEIFAGVYAMAQELVRLRG